MKHKMQIIGLVFILMAILTHNIRDGQLFAYISIVLAIIGIYFMLKGKRDIK